MKCSDYIVQYLIKKGITDVFGYPGGMVTHLMDSFSKYQSQISAHLTYHEQGAAFAACGYAQANGKIGVAYATSGPGATNLITGICNAYFDSIPVLFITGQVNTFETKGSLSVRQRGFQETDIVAMVSTVTKFSARVDDANQIRSYLDQAFFHALTGRKGPVLLDIPMNIFRTEIDTANLESFMTYRLCACSLTAEQRNILSDSLRRTERPVILLGNGAKKTFQKRSELRSILEQIQVPVVTTMLAVDLPGDMSLHYGFIGAYGSRIANFIVAKSDLVISLGARLDVRQVGGKRRNFAPNAKLLRIDIDSGELAYSVREDEVDICADATEALKMIRDISMLSNVKKDHRPWLDICNIMKDKLRDLDQRRPNRLIQKIGAYLPENAVITTDVGQNQVWVAQSLPIKSNQRVFFSGGHGAMGYSLPASIGCWFASKRPVISFNGDGGFQMNLQELEMIQRDRLPIKIIILNNYALGMIRHFQEMYFEENYYQTIVNCGYAVPDFSAIAMAYGLKYVRVETEEDITEKIFSDNTCYLIEVVLKGNTYVLPKLEFGKPNQDQEPLLDRTLFNELMQL